MKFKNFLGNENVKKQISYLIETNHLPHAIVIEGDEGTGKRTLALELAQALVCKGNGSRPCTACSACKKVVSHSHPDVFEFSAKSTPRSFPVDKIREVRKDAYIMPNEAECKVYVLGNASSMGQEAQNALLKILEEPPEYVYIILTAVSKTNLLETVLSRSTVFKTQQVSIVTAEKYIMSKFPDVDKKIVAQVAGIWNGNVGKAIESIADDKMGKYITSSENIAKALLSGNEYELLVAISPLEGNRDGIKIVLSMVNSVFRDALVLSAGEEHLISQQKVNAKAMSKQFGKIELLRLIQAVEEMNELVNKNGNNTLLITKMCFALRDAVYGG